MAEVQTTETSLQNYPTVKPETERYLRNAVWFLNSDLKNEDSDDQINQITDVQCSDLQMTNDINSELEEYILNQVSKDALFKDIESETKESDENISQSRMLDIMSICMVKLASEFKDISTAMVNDYTERQNALCREMRLKIDPQHIKNIEKSEIKELFSKGVYPFKIAKYLTSVMEQCIAIEIRKCLMIKSESNNLEGEENIIPLAKLGRSLVIVLTKACSEIVVSILDLYKTEKIKLDCLYEEFKAAADERIKYIEGVKNEARINKNYDLLTKIDSMKFLQISEEGKIYEGFARDKNKSSIICKYASRSKRMEILSTRKQLKAKNGNPLDGYAL